MMRRFFNVALLSFAACATNVRVDPEGYRCDPGEVCPAGYSCVQSVCTKAADACAAVLCTPRASECIGAALRTFVARCVNGACMSDAADTVCAAGCVAGACKDACAQVVCTTPPVTTCLDTATLHTFATTGTCVAASGLCTYATTDVSCPTGCLAGQCKGTNLCATVTCTMPPPATCVGQTARTFAATGTCDPGTGQCSYTSSDLPCATGCFAGACVTPLTFTQVGPRVRFAVNSIDISPLGTVALVVGNEGRVARWNGTDWADVTTPSMANDLNRVHFVAPQVAYIAGKNRTLWAARATGLSTVALTGSGSANLVALYGRGESNVLVVDSAGNYWKYSGTTPWATGALPSADGPYTVKAAYIDETNRERVVGLCGAIGAGRAACTAYRNTAGWFVNSDNSVLSFEAVGGSFTPPSLLTSEALLGDSDNALVTHTQSGTFTDVRPPTALQGGGIVGIAADGTLANRSVYVLTASGATNIGHLYQVDKAPAGLSARAVLDTYLGSESLSSNVASGATGGVLVAETNRVAGSNNIFRHTASTDEALDLGDDFIGASVDPAGALVVASAFGDVGVRRPGTSTWEYHRAPPVALRAMEARNGSTVLMVGKDYASSDGVLVRWSSAAGFVRALTRANTTFTSLCRVSDAEGWVVGSGGAIYSVTAAGATPVTSPTTKDLFSVDCVAGQAIACGLDGTVLRATNGTWAAVQPAFPMANKALTHCRLAAGTVWALGDGVFQKLEGTNWTQLPAKSGVSALVVRSAADVYASIITTPPTATTPGASAVYRFDGAQWVQSLAVTGVLASGALVSQRLVLAGTGGLLIDGR